MRRRHSQPSGPATPQLYLTVFVGALVVGAVALTPPAEAQASAGVESQELTPAPPSAQPAQPAQPAVPFGTTAGGLDPVRGLEALAEQKYNEGNLVEAEALYRQVVAQLPDGGRKVETLVLVAWLEYLLGKPTEARTSLTAALTIEPNFGFQAQNYTQPFVQLYQEASVTAQEQRRSDAGDAIRAALDKLRAEQPAEARRLLQRALELQPNEPNALYNLALIDLQQQQGEAAIAGFEKLLSLAASGGIQINQDLESRALENLGVLYYNKAFYPDAVRSLERAVALQPNNARSWNNLGLALRRQREPGRAGDAFRRAFEIDPNDESVIANLALVLIEAQKFAEARALLSQATQKFPNNPTLWLNMGLTERSMVNTAGAVSAFRRVLELDPTNRTGQADRAALFLALLYHENGQPEEAVTAARQALAWKPGDIEGLTYLGLSQQALGDLAAARESLERAVGLDGNRPELVNNLGTVYFAQGDIAKAEESFQRALTLRPDFPAAAANLEAARKRRAELAAGTTATADTSDRRPRNLGAKFSAANFPAIGLKGLLVDSVNTNGAAASGGLRKGDLVLLVDGKEMTSPEQIATYLSSTTKSETLTLDLLRDNRAMRVTIRIR